MYVFRIFSLALFLIYLAVFPGSTIVVALDRVPEWGEWMGGALLLLQGAAAWCWLAGHYGRRGALAGLLVFLLAWAVEHVGVTTGIPFGRYRYTQMLQPQLFGTVPAPIACAWVMVAIGAWQLATNDHRRTTTDERPPTNDHRPSALSPHHPITPSPHHPIAPSLRHSVTLARPVVAATLVLLLDLQIETVATRINAYWVWLDAGPYYGVPVVNFVAWWLVGLGMAFVVASILKHETRGARRETRDKETVFRRAVPRQLSYLMSQVIYRIPAYLYLLSTVMFAIVNLARGYTLAGLVGAAALLAIGLRMNDER
jgi:putative membrane protein